MDWRKQMPHQGKTIKVYINDEEYNKIKESAESLLIRCWSIAWELTSMNT